MNQLGLGVMINMLGGNKETVKAYQASLGKTIKSVTLKDDCLSMCFDDETGIQIFDDGQSCCENRYMVTDDDLLYHVGAKLLGAEVASAPDVEDDGECHEVQFLHIKTSKGTFTMSNHVEHNGYYGGFSIVIRPIIQ